MFGGGKGMPAGGDMPAPMVGGKGSADPDCGLKPGGKPCGGGGKLFHSMMLAYISSTCSAASFKRS